MSQNANEQALLKAIDDYIDRGISVVEMQRIAHLLNMQPMITHQIRTKFYQLLSDMDHTRIKKALELLEYLTIFSPPKLLQIVNEDKFMEYIAQSLMESYLQEHTLNLLRLWYDEYSDSKEDIGYILTLIENLESFEIHFPTFYESTYKSAPAGIANDMPAQIANPGGAASLESDDDDFLEKMKDLIEAIEQRLGEQNFDDRSVEYRKEVLEGLMTQINQTGSQYSESKDQNKDYKALQREERVQKIKIYQNRIQAKLDEIRRIEEKNQNPDAQNNNNDSYKIVVSETENTEKKDIYKKMLGVEELFNYKVQQCSLGMNCNFAPVQNQRVILNSAYTLQMHCPFWHAPEDRRRAIMDENGRTTYNFVSCGNKEDCILKDNCGLSHNFFESAYHHSNYKKHKCSFKNCRNGKYCPYFHSKEEKEEWNTIAKPYFDTSDVDEESSDPLEIPSLKKEEADCNTNKGADTESGPKVSNDHSTIKPSQFTAPSMTGKSSFVKHYPKYNQPPARFAKVQEQEEEVGKGNLHSRLIIRKKYDDPSVLTKFFIKSPIFNCIPFIAHYGQTTQGEKDQGIHQQEEEEEEDEDLWKDDQN